MSKKIRIIHAHATRYNIGDDAIVIATHNLLKEATSADYEVVDITRDDYRRDGENIVSFMSMYKIWYGFGLLRLIYEICKCDAVLIGGGELIAGGFELSGLSVLAFLFNKPVYFFGVGVDMTKKSKLERIYTKLALKTVNYFTVRDSEARLELLAFGVPDRKIKMCYDIVFTLGDGVKFERPINDIKKVGVSLRIQQSKLRQFGEKQIKDIANILDELANQEKVEYIFYSFLDEASPYEKENNEDTDLTLIQNTISMMTSDCKKTIYSDSLHPSDIIKSFSEIDILLAMRLHASILGLIAGVNVVPLAYAAKIERVMASVDKSIPVIRLDNELNVSESVATLKGQLENKSSLRQRIQQISEVAKQNVLALNLMKCSHARKSIGYLVSAVFLIPFIIMQKIILTYEKL